MRRLFIPPTKRDTAVRMTIDAWLAEWLASGRPGEATAAVRMRYHGELVKLDLEQRKAALDRAAQAVQLRLGPCHPDRGEIERVEAHATSPWQDDHGRR